jgi:hypothetical protein
MSFFGMRFSENVFNSLPREDDDCFSEDASRMPRSGVCDSAEQFANKFSYFSGDVYFKYIHRHKQPNENGWKWDDAGDYYGEYDLSKVEYLYSANGKKGRPKIDVQCMFSLHEPDDLQNYRRIFIDHGKVN